MYYGGACSLASAAPVNEQYGAAMMAQSLAQGNQFATMTRPYHGGGQTVPLATAAAPTSYKGGRRGSCGMMPQAGGRRGSCGMMPQAGGRRGSCGMMPQAGGWAEAANPMAAVQEAVKNVAALANSATATPAAPATASASVVLKGGMLPTPIVRHNANPPLNPPYTRSQAQKTANAIKALEASKGGRRHRSRKGSRKGRKGSRRGSRRYRGGMAPMSIFGTEGTDVNRASAHLTGQDAALNEALSYSRANPQMGGRRRRRSHGRKYRGGGLLEGAPFSQTSSNMLLADSPGAAAEAAKMESPAWTGVQQGTFLG